MKKISKTAARKLFSAHEPFIAVPSNCSPNSLLAVKIDKFYYGCAEERTFEKFVNAFSYYNCNSTVGKSICFYIPD